MNQELTLNQIATAASAVQLDVFGGLHPGSDDNAPRGTGTLVLLGPKEPGFWDHFTASPEYLDGGPDPIDRWSTRVITALAADLGATPIFPFGGPPYQPFIAWALKSGRAWQSPAGMLVHDKAGLMVSYRGILAFENRIALPDPSTRPCDTCATKPCLTACPVNALSAETGYDTDACHAFLDQPEGQNCMAFGCAARRACPISQSYARVPKQSAFHMRAFHS